VGVTEVTWRPAGGRLARHQLSRFGRQFAIWLIVLAAAGLGQLLSPFFLTWVNIVNLLSQSSVLGIIAIGVTFVMLAGELDVSVAGVMSVSAVAAAAVMNGDSGRVPLAIGVAVAVGLVVGLFNGILVARGVQSFILTLAVGIVLLGGGMVYTGGSPIGNVPSGYSLFFAERVASIPVPVIALAAVLVVAYVVQRATRFGHRVLMVGANASAATLSGIQVTATVIGAYVICGVGSAIAGLVFLGRTGVPNDFSGMGLEFQALAAVVVGGTALAGGRGSVIGTLAGTLLLTISLTLGIIVGLPYGAQVVEYGGLIVVASLAYSMLRREARG
jgi:ribose/xylose/arabinose/galactoside ABC-type transport system permease subunit